MASLNKVALIGNLGADPEVRNTQSGNTIATISVATTEKWKDKDGNPQERTEWHRVKFFGRLAEIAAEYLKKGSQVYVEGSLRTEKYTDKEGIERYTTDIVAGEMKMLGARREEAGQNDRQAKPAQAAASGAAQRPNQRPGGSRGVVPASSSSSRFEDDDIPF